MDALDRDDKTGHPSEEYLERYTMRMCSAAEADTLEEHLLICEQCRGRLAHAEEWVSLMKSALPLGPKASPSPGWRETLKHFLAVPISLKPWALAGAAALTIALLGIPALRLKPTLLQEEQSVSLETTRGAAPRESAASTGRPLKLLFDVAGLPGGAKEVTIVDTSGQNHWTGPLPEGQSTLALRASLPSGKYWVRLATPQPERRQLREFALVVQ